MPTNRLQSSVLQVLQNREAKAFVSCWKAWGKQWSLEYEMAPKLKFTILTGPALELTSNCIGEIKFADGDCYTTTLVRPWQNSFTCSDVSSALQGGEEQLHLKHARQNGGRKIRSYFIFQANRKMALCCCRHRE